MLSGALVLLGAGEGLLSVLVMRSMSAESQSIGANSLPAIYTLGRAEAAAKDMRGKMRSHCVSADRAEMAKLTADLTALKASFDKEIESYQSLVRSPAEEQLRGAIKLAREQLFARWALIEPLSLSGNKKAAMAQFLGPGMRAFAGMQERINALNKLKKEEADHNVAAGADAARKGERSVIFLVLVGIVIGAAFGWLLVRWVSRILGSITGTLDHASEEVSAAAQMMSGTGTQVADATNSQAAVVEQTAAAATEVGASARSNAEACDNLAACLKRMESGMNGGVAAMQELTSTITAIVQSSKKVGKVLSVIDGIAFQTNILALNAAVEAARAGEAGLGFAVVADEVRNLAQRCAEAARQTSALIEESVQSASQGEGGVTVAARAISAVEQDALEAQRLGEGVAHSSVEQSRAIDQIAASLIEIERVNLANAAVAESNIAASQNMQAQSNTLRSAVKELQAITG
jgi:methyl-accepting chemotaxis protein